MSNAKKEYSVLRVFQGDKFILTSQNAFDIVLVGYNGKDFGIKHIIGENEANKYRKKGLEEVEFFDGVILKADGQNAEDLPEYLIQETMSGDLKVEEIVPEMER
ncbi:MAG: hypothetical protein IJW59_01250 [Clostridia bacterium]|nr:hypothetical protein [Clostridia bacterium]